MHLSLDCPPPNRVGRFACAGLLGIAAVALICTTYAAGVRSVAAQSAAPQSFTPESPEVKKAVASAVAYLEKLPAPDDRLARKLWSAA